MMNPNQFTENTISAINLAVDIACRALDPQARLKRRVE